MSIICISQITQTAQKLCRQVGLSTTTVADSFCTQVVSAKPAGSVNNCPLNSCMSNQGTCNTSGATHVCDCGTNWSGPTCSVAAAVSNVVLVSPSPSSPIAVGTTNIKIDWSSTGSNANVEIVYRATSSATPVVISTGTITITANTATVTLPVNSAVSTSAQFGVRIVNGAAVYTSSLTTFNYVWQSSAYGACNVECGSGTQTRTNTCHRSNDNGTVNNSNCNSATAPAPSQQCTVDPTTVCGSNGTCTANKCVCTNGFSGSGCSTQAVINTVTTSTGPFGSNEQVKVSWTYTGANTLLDIVYKISTGDSKVVKLATNVDMTTGSITILLPSTITVSTTAVIGVAYVDATNYKYSPTFTTYSHNWSIDGVEWTPCPTVDCGKAIQTREVKCLRSDTNGSVDVSFCDATTAPVMLQECDATTTCGSNGTCNQDTNTCQCNSGFTGQLCDTATTCTIQGTTSKCNNGGYITSSSTCGTTCTCINNWTSSSPSGPHTTKRPGCDKCGLTCSTPSSSPDGLQATGVNDSTCSECLCKRGYWSDQCSCLETYFTLQFDIYPPYFKSDTSAQAATPSLRKETLDELSKQDVFFAQLINIFVSAANGFDASDFEITYWNRTTTALSITSTIRGDCATVVLIESTHLTRNH